MAPFAALATRNFTTFFAAILIAAPVAGFLWFSQTRISLRAKALGHSLPISAAPAARGLMRC